MLYHKCTSLCSYYPKALYFEFGYDHLGNVSYPAIKYMYLQASGFVNVLDVPDRPKNLKPDEVRAEHIKMSWQRPDDDGGSPITGYVLRMMDLEAGNWITIDEVSFERASRRPITI